MQHKSRARVIRLISVIEKSAKNNLDQLINKAKKSKALGDAPWDKEAWTVTSSQTTNRGHKQRESRLWFTQHGKNNKNLGEPFDGRFADLVKAFVRLRHEIGGQSCNNHMTTVRAFRYLYDALNQERHNPTLINRDHFVKAEQNVKHREAATSAYRVAVHLSEIARILDENQITKVRLNYKTSLKRPESNDRLSETAEKRRNKLMPKQEIFEALAIISNNLSNPSDKIRMCVAKLLVFTGFRVGEALTLPANTLVVETEKNSTTGYPDIDSSGRIKERIGLRYWPEKGAEPRIKWLPTQAGKLIKTTIEELLTLTKPARVMAKWLEGHPNQVNISGYTPEDQIDVKDIAKFIGIKDGIQFCKIRNIEVTTIKQKNNKKRLIRFGDFYDTIVSKRWDKPMLRLPNGKIQLLSESLCVVFYEQLSESRPLNPKLVRPISEQNISDYLCGRPGIKSIFEHQNYLNPDGTPFKIRTHGFRHFLNTIANEGGLTDIELAWWFGRKNIGDNQSYDHRTATQLTEKARKMLLSGEIVGPIADAAQQLTPIDAKKFVNTQVNAVHHTPYGLCLHDFAQSPCDKHLNCLSGCKEFHRTVGDQAERTNLKKLKAEITTATKQARQEALEETWGANNWIKHNETIIENIDSALKIDEGPKLPDNKTTPINKTGKLIGEPL